MKKDFWTNLRIPGNKETLNVELEKALRLADFIEIGELMAHDASTVKSRAVDISVLNTRHPKERRCVDDQFAYVSCWEYQGRRKLR